MKKITTFIVLILFTSFLYTENLRIVKHINIRNAPDNGAELIRTAAPGEEFEVVGEKIGYYKGTVEKGSKWIGKTGWVYSTYLDVDKTGETGTINGEGCVIRGSPAKNDKNKIGFMLPGAVLKILEYTVEKYEVKLQNGSTGWITCVPGYVQLE